ncbi:hypothetical protein [Enterobacter mori]|uniref:hypothetical protein n=1 Tax=Enterobacter mori TaxID=539813 RepID=UPI001B8D4236|nr:hypothetical protein [Enterobacter mori]MBS3046403.1 hypothetical protein [Enterobacter mori]
MNKLNTSGYGKLARGLLAMTLLFSSLQTFAEQVNSGENCQLIANNAQIEYGQHSRGQMLQRAPGASKLPFGRREIVLRAVCQQPTAIKLMVRGASDAQQQFRFGQQGQLSLQVKNAQLDGSPVKMQLDDGRIQNESFLAPGNSLQPVNAGGQPLTGKVLTLQLELEASMTAAATRVNDIVRLEESLTFELVTP